MMKPSFGIMVVDVVTSDIGDVVFRYEACFAFVCCLKPTWFHRGAHWGDKQLSSARHTPSNIFHTSPPDPLWPRSYEKLRMFNYASIYFNADSKLTIWEERTLRKTQLVTVLGLAWVKGFCFPRNKTNKHTDECNYERKWNCNLMGQPIVNISFIFWLLLDVPSWGTYV